MKNGDVLLNTPKDIEDHVVSYFENIFSSENTCVDHGLIEDVIPSLVTAAENSMLTNIPFTEEVRQAVFSMNLEGAPGPDGFGAFFFQKFWDCIAKDVVKTVLQVFCNGLLLPNMNANLVVLIPKVDGANKIEQFRPR